ncbi:MAG: YggS family pyridoxal phosphate-dependent enzyme [Chromatiales bacterium]
MNPFAAPFQAVRRQIDAAEARYGRSAGAVRLVAVSKTRPAAHVRALAELGQRDFAENYLQDALGKMDGLEDLPLMWHFIGHVQSNKTAAIAARFDWVHTLDRGKVAQRLNDQRPTHLPPLCVCVQVNISGETSKSGASPGELEALLAAVAAMPRLRLRGLMTLPALEADFERQRRPFRELAMLYERYRGRFRLDTLSMGSTADMEAAIAEGATLVRIGTALLGTRP